MSQPQRQQCDEKIRDALLNGNSALANHFEYLGTGNMSEAEIISLVERHLISPEFARQSDGKFLLMDDESVSIMLNEEDHIRLQVMRPGLDLDGAYETADKIDTLLDEQLEYAFDDKLGYLTQCPTNLGTGMRASVMLHLPALQEKGISESPYLIIKGLDGNKLLLSDKLNVEPNSITTSPLNLGYDYKHQITASFKLPFVFRALKGVLWIELLFLIGFVICLVWQWNSIKMTLRSVRVQTMGIAHLEHELKKPLATMISAIGGMLKRKESVLCPTDEVKLGMIKARLMKMADITDTMLTSLKTSVLEVEREPIDLQLELEMITEMFTMIRKHARVEYHIAEGLGYPCLDKIYFNYIVINLVDNAIKYGGAHPVVKINFYEEGTDYILVVEDNGMGIAPKDQKQIFKQFYRVRNQQVTKTTGFGLGLTFVHKVVCAYGGKIHIESEIGNGSKFLIILPQVSWKN